MFEDAIFVFGSNEAGRHGKGAALAAVKNHGAVYGQGVGLQGRSYAIPTKAADLDVLPLEVIERYVDEFLAFAAQHPEMTFKVTRVGCGLAGHRDEDIFPLFKGAPDNCLLPGIWEAKRTGVQRLLIAGSRGYTDYAQLCGVVDEAISDWGLNSPVIVSGGARGADSLGERYAKEAGLEMIQFKAKWGELGRAAGIARNMDMAWYSTHVLVFWDGSSPGSRHMMGFAKESRLRTKMVVYQMGGLENAPKL